MAIVDSSWCNSLNHALRNPKPLTGVYSLASTWPEKTAQLQLVAKMTIVRPNCKIPPEKLWIPAGTCPSSDFLTWAFHFFDLHEQYVLKLQQDNYVSTTTI